MVGVCCTGTVDTLLLIGGCVVDVAGGLAMEEVFCLFPMVAAAVCGADGTTAADFVLVVVLVGGGPAFPAAGAAALGIRGLGARALGVPPATGTDGAGAGMTAGAATATAVDDTIAGVG